MSQATLIQTHVFVNSMLLVDHIILEADIQLTRDEIDSYIALLRLEYEKCSDEAKILN